jgi:plasmid stability protein
MNLTCNQYETETVSLKGCHMPTTTTLNNIPDAVYQQLRVAVEAHHRSLNRGAIVCLEAVLLPTRVTPIDRIARARSLRKDLPKGKFRARDITEAKSVGRR